MWGGFRAGTHCTLRTSYRHLRIRLERVLFFVVRIYPQDFDPLLIVEIALPIGKWAFEEFIDLQANFSPAGIESGTREHL